MVYDYIVHPRTQEKIPLTSEKAVKILMTYIRQQNAIQSKFDKEKK